MRPGGTRARAGGWLALVACCALAGQPVGAAAPPLPRTVELSLASSGSRLNGFLYLAAGPGEHPVVLLLHGFPGVERNLDVAQALRRAGQHVLVFDYRGTWGSAGTFSFAHGLEDVTAVIDWIRDPDTAHSYGFDRRRIRLFGHSYGGWLALTAAARDAHLRCVAALAPWNIGYAGGRFAEHPDELATRLAYYRTVAGGDGAPVQARPEDLAAEVAAHASDWDYRGLSGDLADRAVLLMGGSRDSPFSGYPRQAELAAALGSAGGTRVRLVRYEDDHAFGSHRLAIAAEVSSWFQGACRRAER